MELREALVQIAEIRQQMAKGDVFRGYRSAPVAFSGVVALAAALVQPLVVADPAEQICLVPGGVDRGGRREHGRRWRSR